MSAAFHECYADTPAYFQLWDEVVTPMKRQIALGLAVGFGVLISLRADPLSLASASVVPSQPAKPRDREPIKAIPLSVKFDPQKVALGTALFHEPRLSHDNTISCARCHVPGTEFSLELPSKPRGRHS
jgi:cytochrome c peroxidase